MKSTKRLEKLARHLADVTGGEYAEIMTVLKEHQVPAALRAHALGMDMDNKLSVMKKETDEYLKSLKIISSGLQGDDSEGAYSLRAKLAVKIGNLKGQMYTLQRMTGPVKKVIGRLQCSKKFL